MDAKGGVIWVAILLYYDPTYIIVIPALLLAIYAQAKVQGTFNRYMRVRSKTGFTGSQVAQSILRSNGIHDVGVEPINTPLGDHFDPRSKKVRLSPAVYRGSSIAALAVAAHESGHAMQDKQGYAPPLAFRQAILPVANFGSHMAFPPLFILGMLMGYDKTGQFLMSLGILAFCRGGTLSTGNAPCGVQRKQASADASCRRRLYYPR